MPKKIPVSAYIDLPLERRLKARAAEHDLSMSAFITKLIEDNLAENGARYDEMLVRLMAQTLAASQTLLEERGKLRVDRAKQLAQKFTDHFWSEARPR